MNNVNYFFSNTGVGETYGQREVITYVTSADNCSDVKDNFIAVSYDVVSGSISLTTDTLARPQIPGELVYTVVFNGLKYDPSFQDGNLSMSFLASSLTSDSFDSYSIEVSVSSEDMSIGCTFNFDIPAIDIAKLVLLDNGNQDYLIQYSCNEYEVADMSKHTYIWSLNNGYTIESATSFSELIPDKVLSLYTDNIDAVVKVKIVELGMTLFTPTISIQANAYSINTLLSTVINGENMFANIDTFVGNSVGLPDEYNVYHFIDNNTLVEDSFDAILHGGKTLQTVVSTVDGLSSFNKLEIDSYEAYTQQYISEYSFPVEVDRMIDTIVDENKITNSFNANRIITVNQKSNNNYDDFSGKAYSSYLGSDTDEYIKISPELELNQDYNIFTDDSKLFCRNADGVQHEVNMDMIVNKDVIYIDEEKLSIISDKETLKAYFSEDRLDDLESDDQGWMWNKFDNTPVILSKVVENNIISIQFDLSYVVDSSNVGSRLTMAIISSDGSIYEYGFSREIEEAIKIMKDDGTYDNIYQDSFSRRFLVRVTTEKEITGLSIAMIGCNSDNMKIRNIIVTERTM